jgi:hypothetical protein
VFLSSFALFNKFKQNLSQILHSVPFFIFMRRPCINGLSLRLLAA